MPFNVTYASGCPANVAPQYDTQLQAFFAEADNTTWRVNVSESRVPRFEDVAFDRAEIQNGMHGQGQTSRYDHNPTERITIRMSNAALRARGMHFTMHWRANGVPGVVLPKPESEEAIKARRAKQKAADAKKKQDKDGKDKGGKKGDGKGGMGGGASTGAGVRKHHKFVS